MPWDDSAYHLAFGKAPLPTVPLKHLSPRGMVYQSLGTPTQGLFVSCSSEFSLPTMPLGVAELGPF